MWGMWSGTRNWTEVRNRGSSGLILPPSWTVVRFRGSGGLIRPLNWALVRFRGSLAV
jgi:hypothetical protein